MELSHQGWSQRDPGASKCRMSHCLCACCWCLESFSQPDVQQEEGTGKCRQLLAPSKALQRLRNSLNVLESWQPKARTNGAGFHPRPSLLDRCLLHSPGSIPVDGLGGCGCACSGLPGCHFLQSFMIPKHLPSSQSAQVPTACLLTPP